MEQRDDRSQQDSPLIVNNNIFAIVYIKKSSKIDCSLTSLHVRWRILKVRDEGITLNPSIGQLTLLLTVEHIPSSTTEGQVKLLDELSVDEVDESIAYVALVVVIDRQVEEVRPVFEEFLDFLFEHLLGVLVRDVADHKGSPYVGLYLLGDYLVGGGFLGALALFWLVCTVLVVDIRIVVG